MNKKFAISVASAAAAVVAVGYALFRGKSKFTVPTPKSTITAETNSLRRKLGFVSSTFQTKGKELLDPCGSPTFLKGVNKLSVFDHNDPVGATYFPEIAKSGANCVRIVWEMQSDLGNGSTVVNLLSRLDQLITNAKANKLIPIVGLWDYTNTDDGGFSHLSDYVAYWTRPDVVALIKKHQAYLIVNIANEAATGDENNPADVTIYANAYKQAVNNMRQAGIIVPLMIDGMDRGKSLHCFALKGLEILNADPKKNLIFSFHPYWAKSDTDGTTFIQDKFAEVSQLPINIVIGELAGFGAWPGNADISPCSPSGAVDYLQFAQRANVAQMGWLLWEWGPKGDPDCVSMDMTTDGTYASVLSITPLSPNWWVHDLAIDQPFSLKFAQKTPFVDSAFTSCVAP